MDTGSGGTVANVFDQSGRLTVANPGADKERTYTYDAVGNLTSVSSPNVARYNRVYTYDALNRLEHAEGPWGVFDYTYDGVGNRLTKVVNDQTDTYTYVTGTNKIQEITGPVAYTHDANGNITGVGSKVLTYNQNNRLIRVEENSTVLGEYTYNGEGQRVIKIADGVTTVFHYDFRGHIIGESDQDGNFTYEYLYKGGSRLALVDVASGEIFSFLNDRLGTPQMLADSTNTIVWEGIYKPFGETDVNPNSSVVNNFRFPGQYYDEETGFHYNYHRYYDPQTGRYLTPDPIGLLGGINLFIYADGDPVNLIDPDGLESLVAPVPLPLPIVPYPTPQQQAANKQLADAIWNLSKQHYNPDNFITIAQTWWGEEIYDVLHSGPPVCEMSRGKGKGDKGLWNAPGMPGWKNPQDKRPHDPDWWEKPPDWDKKTKWQKVKWILKKAAGALTGAGGVGI
jgi:RHS repeat-associated protein